MNPLFALILISALLVNTCRAQPTDYLQYHHRTIHAEKLILQGSYLQALSVYRELMDQFPFVFLRDQQIATQLAWQLGLKAEAFEFLDQCIINGWGMRSIKKNKFLRPMRQDPLWKLTMARYDSLRTLYENRIDQQLRSQVRSLSLRDQRKALGAIFKFSSQAQDRYAEQKFAPHNERHVLQLLDIIQHWGYPGEKLIGYDPWAQGIFSRHNSISKAYCESDTLYAFAKPLLLEAIKKGEMSPADYAYIEEWFNAVKSGWEQAVYGYLVQLKMNDKDESNKLRRAIGLRPVQQRNRLIDLQEAMGMDFYLPSYPGRNVKISIEP